MIDTYLHINNERYSQIQIAAGYSLLDSYADTNKYLKLLINTNIQLTAIDTHVATFVATATLHA